MVGTPDYMAPEAPMNAQTSFSERIYRLLFLGIDWRLWSCVAVSSQVIEQVGHTKAGARLVGATCDFHCIGIVL